MVNIPPHNVPLEQLVEEGIYPRERTYNRGCNRQYFALPKRWEREFVKRCIRVYLQETFEAHSVVFFEGRSENEVIAQWQE